MCTKFVSESLTITMKISLKLKLSGLYSNLFVIIFSLIFQKILVVGGGAAEKSLEWNHSLVIKFATPNEFGNFSKTVLFSKI